MTLTESPGFGSGLAEEWRAGDLNEPAMSFVGGVMRKSPGFLGDGGSRVGVVFRNGFRLS